MLRQLLRYAALSTALFYTACNLPEEESENPCANGEVLFEDEFEGSELDEGKWDGEPCGRDYYSLNDGVLEFRVERGGCGLQSRSTYTLDDRTLCFEARWKVREREGIALFSGLISEEGGVSFMYDTDAPAPLCGNGVGSDCINEPSDCPQDITNYHTTKFIANSKKIDYYVDDVLRGTANSCIPNQINLPIDFSCMSRDNQEKKCFLDYIKIIRE